MTIQTKDYVITLDGSGNPEAPLTLTPPATAGATVWKWVVIQNLSPFGANIAGVDDTNINVVSLAPYTENKYPYTNLRGAMTVQSWTNPIAGTTPPGTPQIVIQFSDDASGEDFSGSYPSQIASPISIGTITGPVTLTGPISVSSVGSITDLVNVSGETDNLGSYSGSLGTAGQLSAAIPAAPNVYTTLIVQVTIVSGAGPECLQLTDGTHPVLTAGAPFMELGSGVYQAVVPLTNQKGDTIDLVLYFIAAFDVTVTVFGSTGLPAPPMRNDGRAYPVGRHYEVNSSTSATPTTLIPAETGLSILLKTLYVAAASSIAGGVGITLGGITSNYFPAPPAAMEAVIPESGLLLDQDTAVTVTGASSVDCFARAVYDLVR